MMAIRSTLAGTLLCLLVWPAAAGKPDLEASLVDAESNAIKATAVVRVEVVGVELIDPALARPDSKVIQAHLHYRVDDGPPVWSIREAPARLALPDPWQDFEAVLTAKAISRVRSS